MIQIDMPMPEKCSECRFETEYGYCMAMPENFCGITDYVERPKWCPLKEQEAIPPGKESDGNPGKWASWWYVCGACGREIDYHDRFCRYCGQAVKWDA